MSVWLHIGTVSANVFCGQRPVTRSYLCRHPTYWIMITVDLITTSRNSSNVLTEITKTLIQPFVGFCLVLCSTDSLFCLKWHIQWLSKIFGPLLYKKTWVSLGTTFTFMNLADAFIQSDLQCIKAVHLYCQYVCSLAIELSTFEPQEHRLLLCWNVLFF